MGYIQEAAEQLLGICGDDEFVSVRDRLKLELWLELCDLIRFFFIYYYYFSSSIIIVIFFF